MAMASHSLLSQSNSLASNHFRSSKGSINGIPLRALGQTRLFCLKRRDFSVAARLRKVKKHEYPWPEDPDPNVKGGVISHLSHFKPLKEKPKPVTLEFEKPLMDLQKKIVDVKKMASETGLDFSDQIDELEKKYSEALEELYKHLTPIQRLQIARHPNRPTFLDHVFNMTEKFVELHGDRAGYDDPAIVTGLGTINGRNYMLIGQQKGRNTKENIERNFGMPTPHGYRKALRMMYYADHHGFPIITFIDTPGAFADLKSEELGQGEAIAHNLRTMFGLKVPIVCIVIGEGGSGGALAIGCGNKLLMLENSVFYVASPEACAAILWKNAKAAPKAAENLRITAGELCRLQIADGIIKEPIGGAHVDPSGTSKEIKKVIVESMDELVKMDTEELLQHRAHKFRKLSGFQEGVPLDPKKKVNTKKKEDPIISRKDPSTETSKFILDEKIQKLKEEVDHELSGAAKALGLNDRLLKLQEELAKARHPEDPALQDKVMRFKTKFSELLPTAPNYASLSDKLDMLKELTKAEKISQTSKKSAALKQEINQKFKEIIDQSDIKEKMEKLKAEVQNSGASTLEDLDQGLKGKVMEMKKEIESGYASALKSLNLDFDITESDANDFVEQSLSPDLKSKIEELNEEMQSRIKETINTSDLKDKIELLKLEVAKAGKNPDEELQSKIQTLRQQIKESLAKALNSSDLVAKHEELKAEIAKVIESSGVDGSSNGSPGNESRTEVNLQAQQRSFA